jgi:hypothetical protein
MSRNTETGHDAVTAPRRSAPSLAALLEDVVSGGPVAREAAAARLAIAGERAEAAVLRALDRADAHGQALLLGVLDRFPTPRALRAAVAHLASADATVASAAVSAVRVHLGAAVDDTAAIALDALVAACLDAARPETTRLAALEALADLGEAGLGPVRRVLAEDPSARIRKAVAGDGDGPPAGAAVTRLEALAADPGHDPASVQALVGETGAAATLATLHTLVQALDRRERAAATDAERAGWTLALGAAHHTLAARSSRLAVLELRDALERTPPERLGELIAAAGAVGDTRCVEPLARAWTAAAPAIRARIAPAFAAIVARERLTRRHAAAKVVVERWPAAAAALLPTRR